MRTSLLIPYDILWQVIGTSCVAVGRRSGGRLATTLVDRYFHHSFLVFFFSVVYLDPVGHFEAPWWPFWIFEVLIEGMIESKNLFSKS